MNSLETLAIRLASDSTFRAAFASDPRPYSAGLSREECQTLERLQSLLARAPRDLLPALLGQAGDAYLEWPAPPAARQRATGDA